MVKILLAMVAAAVLAGAAWAQESAPATAPAGTMAAPAARFVDERTAVVVRADLSRLDLVSFIDFIELASTSGATSRPREQPRGQPSSASAPVTATAPASGSRPWAWTGQPSWAQVRRAVGEWQGAFRRAGGRELYILSDQAGSADRATVLIVVPLGPKADAAGLKMLLQTVPLPTAQVSTRPATRPAAPLSVMQIGQALVAGREAAIQRARGMKPAERPELPEAMAAAAGHALAVVVIVPQAVRQAVHRPHGRGPPQPQSDVDMVAQLGLDWVAVGVDLPSPHRLEFSARGSGQNGPLTAEGVAQYAADGETSGSKMEGRLSIGGATVRLSDDAGPVSTVTGRDGADKPAADQPPGLQEMLDALWRWVAVGSE